MANPSNRRLLAPIRSTRKYAIVVLSFDSIRIDLLMDDGTHSEEFNVIELDRLRMDLKHAQQEALRTD